MMRSLFAVSLAVTAALSIGPASSGRLSLGQRSSSTSAQTAMDPAATDSSASRASLDMPTVIVWSGEPDVIDSNPDRPKLTMVPGNPELERRIGFLLPAGLSVRQAATGFGDQGQFVSAVHVSRNLGIPFDQLKSKVVDQRLSLGQAIQSLRPDADVWLELTRVRGLPSRDLY